MNLPPVRCFNTGKVFTSEHGYYQALTDVMKLFREIMTNEGFNGKVFNTLYEAEQYMKKLEYVEYDKCPEKLKVYINDTAGESRYNIRLRDENGKLYESVKMRGIKIFSRKINEEMKKLKYVEYDKYPEKLKVYINEPAGETTLYVPLKGSQILSGLGVNNNIERSRIMGREFIVPDITMEEYQDEDTSGMGEYKEAIEAEGKKLLEELEGKIEAIIEVAIKDKRNLLGFKSRNEGKIRKEIKKMDQISIHKEEPKLSELKKLLPDIFKQNPYTLDYNLPIIDEYYVIPLNKNRIKRLIKEQNDRFNLTVQREEIVLPRKYLDSEDSDDSEKELSNLTILTANYGKIKSDYLYNILDLLTIKRDGVVRKKTNRGIWINAR